MRVADLNLDLHATEKGGNKLVYITSTLQPDTIGCLLTHSTQISVVLNFHFMTFIYTKFIRLPSVPPPQDQNI